MAMLTKKTKKESTDKVFRKFHPAGFTLVEVCIVIAVIGVLAAIGYPSLIKWIPNYQLKAASRELRGHLQQAKLHAVKANETVLFSFTVAAPCPGGSYTFTEKTSGNAVINNTLQNGVCLSASTFTNGSSGFDSRALPANNFGGTVTLTHSKLTTRTQSIIQSSAGALRIQ